MVIENPCLTWGRGDGSEPHTWNAAGVITRKAP